MDINLGRVDLTFEQIFRARILHTDNIRSFTTRVNSVIVTVINPLTEPEKASLVAALLALPRDPLPRTRLQEIREKPNPSFNEVVEALKILGIL